MEQKNYPRLVLLNSFLIGHWVLSAHTLLIATTFGQIPQVIAEALTVSLSKKAELTNFLTRERRDDDG